jgi:hypothetical protein
MGIFTGASNRLLRTVWTNAQQLAQELFAILRSDAPIESTSKIEQSGDTIFNGGSEAGGLSITKQADGTTAVDSGQKTAFNFGGPTRVDSSFTFSPQNTTVVNRDGDKVSFDDYLVGGGGSTPAKESGGNQVFFGTVSEDTEKGSLDCKLILEGDERTFVDSETTTVRLFKMHPEGQLHAGDPLLVFKIAADDGTIEYRAQPPTWLG